MRKPNLFLVGAPKAGTTFLWTILKEHKDIYFSTNPEKEINYFSYNELKSNSYYKDYKISNEKDYLNVFKNGQNTKYLADGSVSYFAYPSLPKKLYEFNNTAKIIIIVRNPFARAFSHYNMDKRMGYARESFSDYLKNKDHRHDKFIHQYIENSLYYKHVNNYLEYFSKDQVCVLQLETIHNDLEKLFAFLEIDKLEISHYDQKINTNKEPRNIISRTLQHNRYLATTLKKIIPSNISNFFEFLLYKNAEQLPMKASERYLLEQYINEDFFQFKKQIL